MKANILIYIVLVGKTPGIVIPVITGRLKTSLKISISCPPPLNHCEVKTKQKLDFMAKHVYDSGGFRCSSALCLYLLYLLSGTLLAVGKDE